MDIHRRKKKLNVLSHMTHTVDGLPGCLSVEGLLRNRTVVISRVYKPRACFIDELISNFENYTEINSEMPVYVVNSTLTFSNKLPTV